MTSPNTTCFLLLFPVNIQVPPSSSANEWDAEPNGKVNSMVVNKDQVFSWMPVKNSAVVTSGNYEKYVEFDGIRYSHIINPKTGYPSSGLKSVTIFTENAELADALSTSVFVMGLETGLNLIDQINQVECILVDHNNKIHTSKNIELEKQ